MHVYVHECVYMLTCLGVYVVGWTVGNYGMRREGKDLQRIPIKIEDSGGKK